MCVCVSVRECECVNLCRFVLVQVMGVWGVVVVNRSPDYIERNFKNPESERSGAQLTADDGTAVRLTA